MLRTSICDLFGIEYPIILAGMGGVAMAPLAAAVSNAGGLGVLGAAPISPDDLRAEIRKTKALTARPFAVDLLAPLPQMILPYLPVLYDEGVPIFVAGLAVPEKQVAEMKAHGMTVMAMAGAVKHAVRAEHAGVDVVAAQGTEAGGHTGEIGTLALVPQVVDAVRIPVVAAGGIVDGRGLVAALALGAEGAIIGTRFIATPEATAAPQYRDALLHADQGDTIRTRTYSGKPLRALRNPYILEHEANPSRIRPFPGSSRSVSGTCGASGRRGGSAADCFPAGRWAPSTRSSPRATCCARSWRRRSACCRAASSPRRAPRGRAGTGGRGLVDGAIVDGTGVARCVQSLGRAPSLDGSGWSRARHLGARRGGDASARRGRSGFLLPQDRPVVQARNEMGRLFDRQNPVYVGLFRGMAWSSRPVSRRSPR
jgi:enoyl-[acyl-carrier protein] reductase II